MKRYWILIAAMGAVFVGLFVLVESLQIELLADPTPWLAPGRPYAAALGLALLVGDVLLPVPASAVMVAHGAIFGVLPGALLSLVGGVAASAVGFALGRWGRSRLARWLSVEERRRAEELLAEWGDLAVIVSRPVPILAESVAILAGTTHLGWPRFLTAAAAGTVPAAVLYALAGSLLVGLDSSALVFGLVLAIAALFWLVGRRGLPRQKRVEP